MTGPPLGVSSFGGHCGACCWTACYWDGRRTHRGRTDGNTLRGCTPNPAPPCSLPLRATLPARPLFIVTVTVNQTPILTNQNGNLTPRPPRGSGARARSDNDETPSSSGGPPSRSGSEPSDSADESAPEVIGNSYRNTAQSPPQRTGAVAPTSRPLLSMDPSEGGRRNTLIYPRDWNPPFPAKPAFEGLRH